MKHYGETLLDFAEFKTLTEGYVFWHDPAKSQKKTSEVFHKKVVAAKKKLDNLYPFSKAGIYHHLIPYLLKWCGCNAPVTKKLEPSKDQESESAVIYIQNILHSRITHDEKEYSQSSQRHNTNLHKVHYQTRAQYIMYNFALMYFAFTKIDPNTTELPDIIIYLIQQNHFDYQYAYLYPRLPLTQYQTDDLLNAITILLSMDPNAFQLTFGSKHGSIATKLKGIQDTILLVMQTIPQLVKQQNAVKAEKLQQVNQHIKDNADNKQQDMDSLTQHIKNINLSPNKEAIANKNNPFLIPKAAITPITQPKIPNMLYKFTTDQYNMEFDRQYDNNSESDGYVTLPVPVQYQNDPTYQPTQVYLHKQQKYAHYHLNTTIPAQFSYATLLRNLPSLTNEQHDICAEI